MRTESPGVFAGGDFIAKKYRQITTAVADRTIAALSTMEYLCIIYILLYGNAYLANKWFLCNNCNARYEFKEEIIDKNCPVCGSEMIREEFLKGPK